MQSSVLVSNISISCNKQESGSMMNVDRTEVQGFGGLMGQKDVQENHMQSMQREPWGETAS